MDEKKKQELIPRIIAECERRKQAGKPVRPAKVLEQYPAVAEELRKYFRSDPVTEAIQASSDMPHAKPTTSSTSIYDGLGVAKEPLPLPLAPHEIKQRPVSRRPDAGKRRTKVLLGFGAAVLCLLVVGILLIPGDEPTREVPVETVQSPPAAEPPPKEPEPAAVIPESDTFANSIGMTLRLISAGELLMGSPESEEGRVDNEGPQHRVEISTPFYIQTTEVTQAQWTSVMGTEPWKGEKFVTEDLANAASYVSWDDAVAFCEALSGRDGKVYRLPTEAEWEYACRAGSTSAFSCGDDVEVLLEYAWFRKNAFDTGQRYPGPVGRKRPNEFGLFDMHGNVAEWCSDQYADGYYAKAPAIDEGGPPTGIRRICRGGSWNMPADQVRSAYRRLREFTAGAIGSVGFRVVAVAENLL